MVLDDRGLVVACPQCGQRNRMAYERIGDRFNCGNCHRELSPPNAPFDVPSSAIFAHLTSRSSLPILVDFWAEWCGPCKMVAPELAKVAAELAGRCLVAKVNTEHVPELAQHYRINAIPTMGLFQGGREVGRQSGALPAAGIRRFIESTLGRA